MAEARTVQGAESALSEEQLDRKGWASTGLSALAALVMTSCCILPLLLVSLGVTGVFIGQMAALYQYKWITFSIASVFLAYGFWKAYRPLAAETCADGTCARPLNRRLMRSILWVSLVVVAVAMAFPYVSPYFLKL